MPRALAGYAWLVSFEVVTTADAAASVGDAIATSLGNASFVAKVAAATGAAIDVASVAAVVSSRRPSPAPSPRPTVPPLADGDGQEYRHVLYGSTHEVHFERGSVKPHKHELLAQ